MKPLNSSSFDPVAHLGATIKTERLRQNLNQQTVADLSRTGVRFVRELESGRKSTLRFDKILAVTNTLGISFIPLNEKSIIKEKKDNDK